MISGMTIQDVLRDSIGELYDSESHLVQGLTVLCRKSRDEELRCALSDRREHALEHVRRLERILSVMTWEVVRGPGSAVAAILQGAQAFLGDAEASDVVDVSIAGAMMRGHGLRLSGV